MPLAKVTEAGRVSLTWNRDAVYSVLLVQDITPWQYAPVFHRQREADPKGFVSLSRLCTVDTGVARAYRTGDKDNADTIYSPSDLPQGLRRGSVFMGMSGRMSIPCGRAASDCPKGASSCSPGLTRRRRGYPGAPTPEASNPMGVASNDGNLVHERDTTPSGLAPWRRHDTQGSGADAATLGCGTESRWDSGKEDE